MKSMRCGPIHRDDILPTLHYLSNMTNGDIPFEMLKDGILGSAFKQEVSGDIDIGISTHMSIAKIIISNNIPYQIHHGFGLMSFRINIIGNASKNLEGYDGQVQVDMFKGNVDWMKFTYYSPGDVHSAYKGKYRTELIASMVSAKADYLRYSPDGLLIARIGPVFNRIHGIWTQGSLRRLKKRGTGYVKKMDPVLITDVIKTTDFAKINQIHHIKAGNTKSLNDPKDLLMWLFNDPTLTINTFNTFENLMVEYKKLPSYVQASVRHIFKIRVGIDLDDVPKITDGFETTK